MIYRALLYLLPASFRGEYGSEMRAVYARRHSDAASVFGWIALWLETLADLIITAFQAHWDVLRQDLRHTFRTLRRSPGFTLTAVVVTALGVGATTAAFSITDHVLIRPLPFEDPQRIVALWERVPNYGHMEASPANYRDWKRMSSVFESMGAYRGLAVNLSGDGQPSYLEGSSVTSEVFPLLGVKPALGRVFSAEDDSSGAAGTVILSDTLWRSRFGADPAILNRKVLLDGKPYIVIGVMQADFYFPQREVALWTAMRFEESEFEDRNNNYLNVIAKLPAGTPATQAFSQMNVIASQLEIEYPKENAKVSVTVESLRGSGQVSDGAKILLYALVAASLCLLLITCTNLANLLLARGMVRRKEIAVRTALGAGRERLVRQLLTESLLLALVGGAIGLSLSIAAAPLLARLVPNSLPIAQTPAVDFRVVGFAALFTTLTGVGFGTLPALRNAKAGVAGLHEGARSGVGGRRERLRGLLVAGQVTSSVVLLISCGLLIRALWRIESTNPGFQPEGVLTMRTSLPMPKYEATAKRVEFYNQVLGGVQSLPGVTQRCLHQFHADRLARRRAAGLGGRQVTGSHRTGARQHARGYSRLFQDDGRSSRGRPRCERIRYAPNASGGRRQPIVRPPLLAYSKPARTSFPLCRNRANRRRSGRRHPRSRPGANERAASLPALQATEGRLVHLVCAQRPRHPHVRRSQFRYAGHSRHRSRSGS